jgi:hypothetical protein
MRIITLQTTVPILINRNGDPMGELDGHAAALSMNLID